MSDLAGFDFSLEFAESFATKVLSTIFAEGGTPSSFAYSDAGQPGLMTSKSASGGSFVFQNHLLEVEYGYEFALSDPKVHFRGGRAQDIAIDFAYTLKFLRNAVGRTYDATNLDTSLAEDPNDVRPNLNYAELFRTAPAADPYPGKASPPTAGCAYISFPQANKAFTSGRRLSAVTSGTSLGSFLSVSVDNRFPTVLTSFVNILVKKCFGELIQREVDDYDVTPLVGDLSAFGLAARPPYTAVIGSPSGNVIAFPCNEYSTVGDGDPKKLAFFAAKSEFCASFSEGFFNTLIVSLFEDHRIPDHYALDGTPDGHGPVVMEQPRLAFLRTGLNIKTQLDIPRDGVTIGVNAVVVFDPVSPGQLHVRTVTLDADVQYPGLALDSLIQTITYYLLDGYVSDVLGSLLAAPVNNSLSSGVSTFIKTGALAFAFHAPIRNTKRFTEILPTEFVFTPNVCSLRGNLRIV